MSQGQHPPTRAALLVMHGIGEQQRYQPVDAFARGLAHSLGLQAGQLAHHVLWRNGGPVSLIRLRLPEPLGRHDIDTVDIYEFYWAPRVLGRVSLWQVLRWLARTSLTPLRSFSQNPDVLFSEERAIQRPLWIFLRELLRAGLLVVLAAAIMLPFLYAAYRWDVVVDAARQIGTALGSVEYPLALACWGALLAFALVILNGWRKIRPREGFGRSIESLSTSWWRRASLVSFLALMVLAGLVHRAFDLHVADLIATLSAALRPWAVRLPLAAALIVLALRRPLIKYVGDIVLYVTADERSAYFRTREEILRAATRELRALLTDRGYTAVYVAGHSLGSVIAYDAINALITEVRAEPVGSGHLTKDDLGRLQGLLTFGSPLDKVYYFFRTVVGEEEAVRAQLLSSLEGFRRMPSRRDYGPLKFARYTVPEPPGFVWLNVYSPADLVSGYLDFYMVSKQSQRSYWNPLTAHGRYWTDPKFYAEVADWI